jgi:hypothetical protein
VVQAKRTISAAVPSGSHDLRPRPGATRPIPSGPSASNRRRQARTLSSVVRHRATSFVATPSAASNNARARVTCRCGNDDDRAIRSTASRCSAVIDNGGATRTGIPPPKRPS